MSVCVWPMAAMCHDIFHSTQADSVYYNKHILKFLHPYQSRRCYRIFCRGRNVVSGDEGFFRLYKVNGRVSRHLDYCMFCKPRHYPSHSLVRAVGEMRSSSMTDFLWGLENSGWLKHIKAILDAGVFISRVCTQTDSHRQAGRHSDASANYMPRFSIMEMFLTTQIKWI